MTKMTIKSLATMMEAMAETIDDQSLLIRELQDTIITMKVEQAKAPSTTAPRGTTKATGRDYGPASNRAMTEGLALRILVGRYRKWSVRKIADELGLSRGQVYSLKGEYTMKGAWKTARRIEARRAERAAASS